MVDGNLRAQRIFGILVWAALTIQPIFTWSYIGWKAFWVYILSVPMLIRGILKFNAPEKIREDKPSEESEDKDKDKKEGEDKDKEGGDEKGGEDSDKKDDEKKEGE